MSKSIQFRQKKNHVALVVSSVLRFNFDSVLNARIANCGESCLVEFVGCV